MGGGSFAAGVAVESFGSLNLNISDNQISNITTLAGDAVGITVLNETSSVFTAAIQNNQISTILGMGTAVADGIQVSNNDTGTAVYSILDNQVSGVSSSGTPHGIFVFTSAGTTGSTCLTLIGNTAPPEILLERGAGSAPFTLNSTSGNNTPTPTEIGITHGSCP